MKTALCLCVLSLMTGCAHYEYNLTEPPDLARHIGTNVDQIARLDPLEYRFRTVDNRLVIRIYNLTDDQIQLLGDRSVAVDGNDQSHPLLSQTIAPRSFIKLVLPPQRPYVAPYGPTLGIGVSGRVDSGYTPALDYPSDVAWPYYYDTPRYVGVYGGAAEALYWEWKDETSIRLTLTYRRGTQDFQHPFAFRRQKM